MIRKRLDVFVAPWPRRRPVSLASGAIRSRVASAALLALLVTGLWIPGCAGAKSGRPRPTNQDRYQLALKLIEQKKLLRARTILSEIGVRQIQDTELDPFIKIALADAYFLDKGITNIIEAQARYEQFLNFYPSHEKAPYAQHQLGVCLFKQSAKPHHDQEFTHKALEEFSKVRLVDPNSEYVEKAEEMSVQCREKLARHEYDVGRFYLKRSRSCRAAAWRFRRILDEFSGFSDIQAAHFYLGRALLCDNNPEEGKIYLRKLVNDYPDSTWASEAKETLAQEDREAG